MAVATALRATAGALKRNPSVVGVVVLALLIQTPLQFAQAFDPLAAAEVAVVGSLVTLLAVPFVFAGLVGMADEALDGATGLGTFVACGKRRYLSMLGSYGILLVGSLVVGVVSTILFGVVALAVFAPLASGGPMSESTFLVLAPVFLFTSLLVWFLPLAFVQFYGHAIVIDDCGAFGGFKRSVSLVRANLVSVVGYSLLVFGAGLVVGLVSSVPSALLSTQRLPADAAFPEVSLPVVATVVVLGNVVVGVVAAASVVFSVAFYRTLDDPASDGGEGASARGTAA